MFNTVLENTNYLDVSNLVHGLICLTVYLSIGQLKSDNSAGRKRLFVGACRTVSSCHFIVVCFKDYLERTKEG